MKPNAAFALFFLSISPMSLWGSQNFYALPLDGLNIRSLPNSDSKIVDFVQKGNPVEFIKYTDKQQEIQGIKGTWVEVKTAQAIGFAFGPYLSRTPLSEHKKLKTLTSPQKTWKAEMWVAQGDQRECKDYVELSSCYIRISNLKTQSNLLLVEMSIDEWENDNEFSSYNYSADGGGWGHGITLYNVQDKTLTELWHCGGEIPTEEVEDFSICHLGNCYHFYRDKIKKTLKIQSKQDEFVQIFEKVSDLKVEQTIQKRYGIFFKLNRKIFEIDPKQKKIIELKI